MSFKKVAYGVFLIEGEKATCIFSDEGGYAVYERQETGEAFKIEMESRWENVVYEVKEVVIEVTTDD